MLYGLSLYSVESFKYPIAGKSISKETEALRLPLDFFHKPHAVIGPPTISYKNDRLLTYTSTLAVITITTIFATLAISKRAKLLDYSSVLSTFSTLFLCLITNSLKDPGYHGCLCRCIRMSAMRVAMEAHVAIWLVFTLVIKS